MWPVNQKTECRHSIDIWNVRPFTSAHTPQCRGKNKSPPPLRWVCSLLWPSGFCILQINLYNSASTELFLHFSHKLSWESEWKAVHHNRGASGSHRCCREFFFGLFFKSQRLNLFLWWISRYTIKWTLTAISVKTQYILSGILCCLILDQLSIMSGH